MARVSAERAWQFGQHRLFPVINGWSIGEQSIYEQLFEFEDIEDDSSVLTRERSEWYIERFIAWIRPRWAPATPTAAQQFNQVMVRLGTLEINAANALDPLMFSGPSFGSDNFGRIFNEEWTTVYRTTSVAFDGASLVAAPSEGADALGALNGPAATTYKVDLRLKARLQEGSGVYVQAALAEDFGTQNDEFYGCDIAFKVLWRRGR